jgi:hypothetical protein
MQKLFDAAVDYPLVLRAANEEFPRARAVASAPSAQSDNAVIGWNAFEIWRTRMRLAPGVASLFLPTFRLDDPLN